MKKLVVCKNNYLGMCERAQWCKKMFGKSATNINYVSSRTKWHSFLSYCGPLPDDFYYVFSFFDEEDYTLFLLTWE